MCDFDEVWQGPSVPTLTFAAVIEMKDIAPKNKEEILSIYARQQKLRNAGHEGAISTIVVC